MGGRVRTGGEAVNATTPRRLHVLRYHVPECTNATGERPCPNTACRYALKLDPHIGADESCSLDVAGQGDHTEERVGQLMGVTRQAIQQDLVSIIRKIRRRLRDRSRPVVPDMPIEIAIPVVRATFCAWCASALPVNPKSADGHTQKRRRFCSVNCNKGYSLLASKLKAGPIASRLYANKAVALMAAKDRAVEP